MDGQMKKGTLEMCILFQLYKKEMYGYEIMKIIKEAFLDVHEATVYAILRRLNADGYADTYIGKVSNGPKRKYYKITPSGKINLAESIQEWKAILSSVKDLGIE